MLVELHVAGLGVIDQVTLGFGPGMTALTGETGAGKTMLVEAIGLLVGGRADPVLVRPGASEARVDGRFVVGDREVLLARVIPAEGRSRAYVDGRPASAGELAEWGARLLDLHGQHAHQSLLAREAQRSSLDRFAQVDLAPLEAARATLAEIDDGLAALGGDSRERARELDLVRYQVDEIDRAAIEDLHEDEQLQREEDRLADAVAHQEAGASALEALTGDGGAGEALSAAIAALADRGPFASEEVRLRDLAAELADLASALRSVTEAVEDDPERLAEVGDRRNLLQELRRKYGDTLADVLAERERLAARLAELESWDARAAQLDAARGPALDAVAAAAAAVGSQRRAAAPTLAAEVQGHLVDLAMGKARLDVAVGAEDPGDDVELLLAANAGSPLLPLTKVASGGELARTMLALRLVLTAGPPTLVFDEVDAGIGGSAALAVGRSLARLGEQHQVLVVTHLPQVAAYADAQVAISKSEREGSTVTSATRLDDAARVVELSRMLSGTPDSTTVQDAATELLLAAGRERHR